VPGSTVLVFVATCPKCRKPRTQSRCTIAYLRRLLSDDHQIHVHCAVCNASWPLREEERAHVAKALAIVRQGTLLRVEPADQTRQGLGPDLTVRTAAADDSHQELTEAIVR